MFEPHADIIVEGGREVQYGDKLNLAIGKSGLILDVVVEDGNPADAERFLPMLDRQIARRGRPRPMAAMPAATISNRPRPRGVRDVAFRAGIEAGILASNTPMAEHAAPGAGLDHFKAYTWSAVVVHNLMLIARLKSP